MCAIIPKDAIFDCSMNYGAPPSYTIISENTNINEMTLTTRCSLNVSTTDDNGNSLFNFQPVTNLKKNFVFLVPEWFQKDCLLGLRPVNYANRPKNVAVLKGL